MKASPPSPEDCGSTRVSASWMAIAASTAEPPACSTWKPTRLAIGLAVTTTLRSVTTSCCWLRPVAPSGCCWASATPDRAVPSRVSRNARRIMVPSKRARASAADQDGEHDKADGDAVPCERREVVPRDEADEPAHDDES